MDNYRKLCNEILVHGVLSEEDRTGTQTRSSFGHTLEFDLRHGVLPVVTSKRVNIYNIIEELNWFLRGSTNSKELSDSGVNIWNAWADDDGELGPVYGKQWVDWAGINQINRLIEGLRENPSSRRHIVSAWNVGDIDKMALPPCHMMFQCYVSHRELNMQMYQRSADLFLGVPYNITSYALLLAGLAAETGLRAGKLRMVFGDAHIYENHVEQVERMLALPAFDRPEYEVYTTYHEASGSFQIQALIEPFRCGPFIPAPIAV